MLDFPNATNNLSADAVVATGKHRVGKVSVVTAGSGAGALHDCATVGAAAASNKICTVPAAVGMIDLNWPVRDGIVYKAGTSQVVAISFD